jgi:hypothetical protein
LLTAATFDYHPGMAKHSSHILEMARKGAEHRYDELTAEIAALVKHFPHLAARTNRQLSQAVSRSRAALEAEAPKARRRVRKMSAAARKAVSQRMKKYWAARRKTKKS